MTEDVLTGTDNCDTAVETTSDDVTNDVAVSKTVGTEPEGDGVAVTGTDTDTVVCGATETKGDSVLTADVIADGLTDSVMLGVVTAVDGDTVTDDTDTADVVSGILESVT